MISEWNILATWVIWEVKQRRAWLVLAWGTGELYFLKVYSRRVKLNDKLKMIECLCKNKYLFIH